MLAHILRWWAVEGVYNNHHLRNAKENLGSKITIIYIYDMFLGFHTGIHYHLLDSITILY